MTALRATGNIPNTTTLLGNSVNERAARRSWFVPTAKNWVNVENGNILRTMLSQILTGKLTVKQAATLGERQHHVHAEPAVGHAYERSPPRPAPTGLGGDRCVEALRSTASIPVPLLILPVIVVIRAILGYPLYKLVTLSFQQYGLSELIQHKGEWIGLDNYRSVLHDSVFWRHGRSGRSIFTVANVALTIGARHADRALLLIRVVVLGAHPPHGGARARLVDAGRRRGAGLVLDDELPERRPQLRPHASSSVGDYSQHDWYATTFSKLAMVTLLIVWGAIPFVTITVYAGLAQVPRELVEAAEIDGAGPAPGLPGRHVTRF